MLTSNVEKITLGLLLPLAVVGNMGAWEQRRLPRECPSLFGHRYWEPSSP